MLTLFYSELNTTYHFLHNNFLKVHTTTLLHNLYNVIGRDINFPFTRTRGTCSRDIAFLFHVCDFSFQSTFLYRKLFRHFYRHYRWHSFLLATFLLEHIVETDTCASCSFPSHLVSADRSGNNESVTSTVFCSNLVATISICAAISKII